MASVGGLVGAFLVAVVAGGALLGSSLAQAFDLRSPPPVEPAAVTAEAIGAVLVETDANGPLFRAPLMRPGDSLQRCVPVSHSADSGRVSLSLYASVSGTGLGDFLDLTIDQGTGGGYHSCAGFVAEERLYAGTLSGFASDHHDFATGTRLGRPSPGNMVYRFELSLRDDNTAQGTTTGAVFTWEAQEPRH